MRKPLSDNEMDAIIERGLSRLPVAAPSRAFGQRVMARVALPQPRAVVLYQRARAWAVQPSHAVVLGGAYALSAVIALAVVVPWLLAHSPAIAFVADWALARGANVLRDAVLALAQWSVASGLTSFVRSLPLSGPVAVIGGTLMVIAYAGSALGLRYLLRAPRRDDAVRVRA